MGRRSEGPFVAVNCAALPDGLVEAELFGHVRGAFTGAVSDSKGYLAEANGGTLFLDEIGEMSLHAQARLLRVLETREIRPVGGARSKPVDIRVISATNQPLQQLIGERRFREDLYYRLNIARLDLPPLKDRKEDIPLLLRHLLDEFNHRDHLSVQTPDNKCLDCLMAHDWPGNVRELRNLMEVIFIDPPSGHIRLVNLPPTFRDLFSNYRTSSTNERTLLVNALERTNWNKSEAAKHLDWSRMTLYRKMEKYRIERSS